MKKFTKWISMMTAAVMAATTLTACGTAPAKAGDTNTMNADDATLTYISMRINPEIEVVADENGEIVSVNAVNEDGEVVLAEVDLVGQSVAEAGETFTEIATELGYLDVDSEDATVYIDAVGENEELCEKLESGLSERIHKYFDNNGIFGKVSPETLEEYADKVEAWNVSAGQAKMIVRLLDMYPEMTEEEALLLNPAQIMEMIKDHGKSDKKVGAAQREEMKTEVEALKEKYAATFALKDEIRALKQKLEDETLTEDEKTAIRTELETKQAAYDEQMQAYRDEVAALKDSYREKTEEMRNEIKQKAKEKREQNADKIKEHKKTFEAAREDTEKKIREWREGREDVIKGNKGGKDKPAGDAETPETEIEEPEDGQKRDKDKSREDAPEKTEKDKDKSEKTTEETTVAA